MNFQNVSPRATPRTCPVTRSFNLKPVVGPTCELHDTFLTGKEWESIYNKKGKYTCSSKGKNSTLMKQEDLKIAELSQVTFPSLSSKSLLWSSRRSLDGIDFGWQMIGWWRSKWFPTEVTMALVLVTPALYCLSRIIPKGLRAESARAVTGRRNSHRWERGRLFEPSAGFFYGNSCNFGTKSRKIVSKVGN